MAAAGNDGPYFATMNTPADMPEVIAVGGLSIDAQKVAQFSSRGMTRSELLEGQGRIKPEVLTFSERILSQGMKNQCEASSGTSLSSAILTGQLALLIEFLRSKNVTSTPSLLMKIVQNSA